MQGMVLTERARTAASAVLSRIFFLDPCERFLRNLCSSCGASYSIIEREGARTMMPLPAEISRHEDVFPPRS
jgi:hypothetical protein